MLALSLTPFEADEGMLLSSTSEASMAEMSAVIEETGFKAFSERSISSTFLPLTVPRESFEDNGATESPSLLMVEGQKRKAKPIT